MGDLGMPLAVKESLKTPLYTMDVNAARNEFVYGGGGGAAKTGFMNGFIMTNDDSKKSCKDSSNQTLKHEPIYHTGDVPVMCVALHPYKQVIAFGTNEFITVASYTKPKKETEKETESDDIKKEIKKEEKSDENKKKDRSTPDITSNDRYKIIGKVEADTAEEAPTVKTLSWSSDGVHLVSGGEDGWVRLWKVDISGSHIEEIASSNEHKGAVNSVSFSWDGDFIASTSIDATCIIWKGNNLHKVKTLLPPKPPGPKPKKKLSFRSCRFGLGGRLFTMQTVFGGWAYITGWSTANWQPLKTVVAHKAPLTTFALSPDRDFIAAGSGEGDIIVLRSDNLEKIFVSGAVHTIFVTGVGFSASSSIIPPSTALSGNIDSISTILSRKPDANTSGLCVLSVAADCTLALTPVIPNQSRTLVNFILALLVLLLSILLQRYFS